MLLRKLSEQLVTQYERWLHESEGTESVYSLLEWLHLEAEFLVVAHETVEGITKGSMQIQSGSKHDSTP